MQQTSSGDQLAGARFFQDPVQNANTNILDSRFSILEWAFRTAAINQERRIAANQALEEFVAARDTRLAPRKTSRAFSLVELLLVIAIIAIMASIVIAAFSNASADSRGVLVRQQQAVVQEAVNSWISHTSSGTGSLASAKTTYNAATTGIARLALVQAYLDDATYAHFVSNTSNNNKVRTDAMAKTAQYLEITTWASGSYPKVNLVTE